VKRVPENLTVRQVRVFLDEIGPLLKHDRLQIVFDFSLVRTIDSAGVDMLLLCARQAARRDGELKFAALSPQALVMLNLTRVSRLFEIFDNTIDAVRSFSGYLPNAVRQTLQDPQVA
jgi:anti-anti-sigma factor